MSGRLLETNLIVDSVQPGIPAGQIEDVLDFAYRSKRKKAATLDLLIADDKEITRLNRRHLGRDNATDVLAFEDGEAEGEAVRLGDVVISAETARRVATERGGDFARELTFYALHGLFHVLGMRDDSDAERRAMLRAQAKAMREFGLDMVDGLESMETTE